MRWRFPRSATAFAAMLVGVVVMALAVSTPGWSIDERITAPAIYRVQLHTVGSIDTAPTLAPRHPSTPSS